MYNISPNTKKIDKEISLMCEKLGKNILNLDYF